MACWDNCQRNLSKKLLGLGAILCLLLTQSARAEPVYQRAVVAADHQLASSAGVEILKQGGNVVDAAVATGFALSVLHPSSSGLGGGGFMVIWNAKSKSGIALDYRERAPLAATRDMYAQNQGDEKQKTDASRKGHLAIAVPGHVAGLCYAAEKYGNLGLKSVLAPAIRLAKCGFAVDAKMRKSQLAYLKLFQPGSDYKKRFPALFEKYLNGGKPWLEGDRFYSPQLAVLELIAEQGADGFYGGAVATAILKESHRGGGILTEQDFESVEPVRRKPLRGKFGDFTILTMPPPSSGGVALLETLNILEAYEAQHPKRTLEKLGHNSPDYLHLLTEVLKHSFADRAEFLGDADFVSVPVKKLISKKNAKNIAARIDWEKTLPLKEYGRYVGVDDSGTTHFSVVAAAGNADACTETINTGYGSFVVEPKFGIVLNNEMDDFAAIPGKPNIFGLIQSEANAVEPRKKPLSSMTPTVVIKDGKAVHVLGASGGPRIISSSIQVYLNLTRFGMTPQAAIDAPRIHHQWVPNSLYAERDLFERVGQSLKQRGHAVVQRSGLAATQAVSKTKDGLQGGSDPRKGGKPAGY